MRVVALIAASALSLCTASSPDSSFVDAVVRLCETNPRHTLCKRVQIIDNAEEVPTRTTKRPFFRSLKSRAAHASRLAVPEFAEPSPQPSAPSRATFSRYLREPPVAPPVQTTTPSIWAWMNDKKRRNEADSYMFEESTRKRAEIFKKRWLRALRARKARRRAALAAKTYQVESEFPSQLSTSDLRRILSILETHSTRYGGEEGNRREDEEEDDVRRRRSRGVPGIDNDWGFTQVVPEVGNAAKPKQGISPFTPATIDDPTKSGALSSLGDVANVGFGFGIGVPGNDPVSVQTGVGVGLGRSGLAAGLPRYQTVFGPQGEAVSMNDYDGNKQNIVAGRWARVQQAIQEGRLTPPPILRPGASLVNVNSGVGVGG